MRKSINDHVFTDTFVILWHCLCNCSFSFSSVAFGVAFRFNHSTIHIHHSWWSNWFEFQSTIKQCFVIKHQENQPTGYFYCPEYWRLPSVSWPAFEAVIAFFPNDPDPPRAWPYCQKTFKWTKDHKDVYFDEEQCLRPQKTLLFSSWKNWLEAWQSDDVTQALWNDQSCWFSW